MAIPKISLDQWTTLVAVVEAGGYAKAGDALHKSQSTLTYAIQRLEELLGVKVFEIRGRRAVLTPTGEVLYRRGETLVDDGGRAAGSARGGGAGGGGVAARGKGGGGGGGAARARRGRACEGLGSRDPNRRRDPFPHVAPGAVPGSVFRRATRHPHRAL